MQRFNFKITLLCFFGLRRFGFFFCANSVVDRVADFGTFTSLAFQDGGDRVVQLANRLAVQLVLCGLYELNITKAIK